MKKVFIFISGIIFAYSLIPILQSITEFILGIMEKYKIKVFEDNEIKEKKN